MALGIDPAHLTALRTEIATDPASRGYLSAPLSATREQHEAKIRALGKDPAAHPYNKRRDHVFRLLRALEDSGQTRTVVTIGVDEAGAPTRTETLVPIFWSRAEALGVPLAEITESLCAELIAEAGA